LRVCPTLDDKGETLFTRQTDQADIDH